MPRFTVVGDYDVQATFSQLKLVPRNLYCGIILRTILQDQEKPYYDVRRIGTPTNQLAQSVFALIEPQIPGRAISRTEDVASEMTSGRFRLARRGTKLYHLMAEGDSNTFQLLTVEDVSRSDSLVNGVRLQTFGHGGATDVLWQNITLRAESLIWHPIHKHQNATHLNVVHADGTGVKKIVDATSMGFQFVICPEWSVDGRKILSEMHNGSVAESHIIVMNADGGDRRDLGRGTMPSFSREGDKIVFSQPGEGVMMMNSNGTGREVVDAAGWGVQWSPNGQWLAYGKAGNVVIMDVATRKSRMLLTGNDATRYSRVYWNLAWSHDNRGIAFKAQTRANGQQELAYASLDQPDDFRVLLGNAVAILPDVCFTPDNERVVVCYETGPYNNHKLHTVDLKQPGIARRLDLVPSGQAARSVAWSRDGKFLVVSSMPVGEPTEWTSAMKSD